MSEHEKMRNASYLLPDPGGEVVRGLLDEIHALETGRAEQQEPVEFTDYSPGLLNSYGGGDVDWWQTYIHTEVQRANDHWRQQAGGGR